MDELTYRRNALAAFRRRQDLERGQDERDARRRQVRHLFRTVLVQDRHEQRNEILGQGYCECSACEVERRAAAASDHISGWDGGHINRPGGERRERWT